MRIGKAGTLMPATAVLSLSITHQTLLGIFFSSPYFFLSLLLPPFPPLLPAPLPLLFLFIYS